MSGPAPDRLNTRANPVQVCDWVADMTATLAIGLRYAAADTLAALCFFLLTCRPSAHAAPIASRPVPTACIDLVGASAGWVRMNECGPSEGCLPPQGCVMLSADLARAATQSAAIPVATLPEPDPENELDRLRHQNRLHEMVKDPHRLELRAAPGTPATLDAAALARLQALDPSGENDLLPRVLRAYQSSAARLMPQLEAARLAGDHAGIRLVAHTLKSSSASIGALQLSILCAEVEALIRTETTDGLKAGIDSLTRAMADTLQAVAQLLERRPC